MNKNTNWYSEIPKSLLKKNKNPSYKNHKMNVPFRALIVGGSGSGKTTLIMELIKRASNTFGIIVLCVKNADEPLYQFLISKLSPENLHVYQNGEIPPLDKYKGEDCQILMVFDDLVNEKKQDLAREYFIRGRKIAGGISMCYLTQSYFQTDRTIRLQCNYIMLKKLTSTRDLKTILSDFNLGLDKDYLVELYKVATADKLDFLMIDIDAEPSHRFRKNFLEVIS
jgi:hypothetical protein